MRGKGIMCVSAAVLAISAVAMAQAPAAALAPAEARSTVGELAGQLVANFVFPETGERYATALRTKLAAGGYDNFTDAKLFADEVTKDLQAVAPDGHLRLFVSSGPTLSSLTSLVSAPAAVEDARWIADGVAYIRFNLFPHDAATSAKVDRFMADHATARALIIDVRGNRGGGLAPMDVMLPYLYARPMTLAVMETRAAPEAAGFTPLAGIPSLHRVPSPKEVVRREHRISPHPHEKRMFDAQVFYLTSRRTASAAEHLAMAFKSTKRAVLIGETTAGAGNFGMAKPVGRFSAFIPVGRTYDPATGQGWEGIGVEPDVKVPAKDALDAAMKQLGVTAFDPASGGAAAPATKS